MEEVDSSQIFADEQPDNVMEVTLQEFDDLVKSKKLLDELLASAAFNDIIVGKYFTLEHERLSGLLKSDNSAVVKDRDVIVAKIVAIGYMEQFIKSLSVNMQGIDNPEQRIELIRQMEEYEVNEGGSDE